jgi:FKBP-type peptidyl-prolyl cis-trans isomerase
MIFEGKRRNLRTMNMKVRAAALVFITIVIVACNPAKKYEEEEKSLIQDYVLKNGITVSPDANGIYITEVYPGTGDLIQVGDSVGVWYTGTFLSGKQFDSNTEATTPYRFRVGTPYLIEGWSLALVKMKLGTKAEVLLPSKVAYGSMGFGTYDQYGYYYTLIPGYTPLLFEMEVVELTRKTKK